MTAPCRCQDLRRALLGLVRSMRREKEASAKVADTGRRTSYQERACEMDDLCAAERTLRRSIRRARRLLRETRVEKRTDPAQQAQCVCACGNKKKWNERCCDTCLYQGPPETGDTLHSPTEALNRIMEAWQAFSDSTTAGGSLRAEESLWETLRSVARERGFGGEDGGTR